MKAWFEHTVASATLFDTNEISADTLELFFALIQRDATCLEALRDWQQSLPKLERLLSHQVDILDATLDAIRKPLLDRLRDKSERCRELRVRKQKRIISHLWTFASWLPPKSSLTGLEVLAGLDCSRDSSTLSAETAA